MRAPQVPRVLAAVFDCTLAMITQNMEDYPEHRINFFQLLKEINHSCFRAFFMIPAEAFRVPPRARARQCVLWRDCVHLALFTCAMEHAPYRQAFGRCDCLRMSIAGYAARLPAVCDLNLVVHTNCGS